MKMKLAIVSLGLLLAAGIPAVSSAEESNAFRDISAHYEAIRLALVDDSLADVADHARAIEHRVHELAKDFDAKSAGVPAEKSAECKGLLPEVASAAAALAEKESLDGAREALFELSKPMGRYRKLAGIEGTTVVFCSMAKKAWIQPHGEIGNPYMGEAMPTCGEVIAD
jgi:hypothetical protein